MKFKRTATHVMPNWRIKPCRYFLFKGCTEKTCGFLHKIKLAYFRVELPNRIELFTKFKQEFQPGRLCKFYYAKECTDPLCEFQHILKKEYLQRDVVASIGYLGKDETFLQDYSLWDGPLVVAPTQLARCQ